MNRIVSILFLCGLLTVSGNSQVAAQNIVVGDFAEKPTDLTPRMDPVYDNNGERCANLVFNVKDTTFVIEGNLGVLKRKTKVGEIRLWVPEGTSRLTIRHEGTFPLRYEIPLRIVTLTAYHTYLDLETKKTKNAKSPTPINFYIGAGFNALSIQGSSVAVGVDISHHVIEAGGIYGIQKSDNLYFYSGEKLTAAYQYQAIRGYLKYGYDFKPAEMAGVMPFVGVAMNVISGKAVDGQNINTEDFKRASSVSVIGGVRLSVLLGKYVRLHITPEYDFGAYKSKNCKLLNENDDDIKKWTEGIGLNVGVMLNF